MSRHEMPRIFELHDSINGPLSPNSLFHDFEDSIAVNSIKRERFIDLDSELVGLSLAAWEQLKKEVLPTCTKWSRKRGWEEAFNKLNQAKGYNYLLKAGCTNVEFIPLSSRRGHKTPDVRGQSGLILVLCEVKTINISDEEINVRINRTV